MDSDNVLIFRQSDRTLKEAEPVLRWYVTEEARRLIAADWITCPQDGDAGFDIRSMVDVDIRSQETVLVPTGIHFAIPIGYVGIIKDRSSLASKAIFSSGGVIDSGYRGELKVLLSNSGSSIFSIAKGDRVAQMLVLPCVMRGGAVEALEDLGITERGINGFGSTGTR
jgi:dUTP pyrophosphatase